MEKEKERKGEREGEERSEKLTDVYMYKHTLSTSYISKGMLYKRVLYIKNS